MDSNDYAKQLKRADPSTIHNKFLVGYQGWFTCAGDGDPVGPGHHGWLHWFTYPMPDGGRPNTDLWPDVSEYSPSELYPAPGLKLKTGEQASLFSSRNSLTVQRHFHWMARHAVDGAFLQRFLGQCDIENGQKGIRKIRDEVGARVKEAAERQGRVFAIMYDLSGVDNDRILSVIQKDWHHLVHEEGVLDSPSYLHEQKKPVVALWGFGFDGRNHTPELVRSVVAAIRSCTPGGAYIIGGIPAYWRTASDDADRDPAFLEVWLNEFDALSPWTVGRYRTEEDAVNFAETKIRGDIELLKKREQDGFKNVDYLPVILPGGSGFNLSEGNWGWNDIKRNGGRFLWQQIVNVKRLGVKMVYGAMWDEYDEGTAFMPVVEKKNMLPQHDKYKFMALDEDGYDLPSDWYMRICGFAAEGLRNERLIHDTFPYKELQDYWSSRPRYEEEYSKPEGSSSQLSYQNWLHARKVVNPDEPPPPPYTMEAEEVTPNTAPPVSQPVEVSTDITASTSISSSSQSSINVIPRPFSQAPSAGIALLSADFANQSLSRPAIRGNSSSFSSAAHAAPPIHPTLRPAAPSTNITHGLSPPPLHPTRLSSVSSTQAPRPNLSSKPMSHDQSYSRTSQIHPPLPVASLSSPTARPPTDPQWPPLDWRQEIPQPAPYRQYVDSSNNNYQTFSSSALAEQYLSSFPERPDEESGFTTLPQLQYDSVAQQSSGYSPSSSFLDRPMRPLTPQSYPTSPAENLFPNNRPHSQSAESSPYMPTFLESSSHSHSPLLFPGANNHYPQPGSTFPRPSISPLPDSDDFTGGFVPQLNTSLDTFGDGPQVMPSGVPGTSHMYSSIGPPPPVPPRRSRPSTSQSYTPTYIASASPVRGFVDRVTSRRAREQVGSLAEASGKIFNKFTK